MIKCIASDMDGTLLNHNHVVSEENAQAIKAAQAQGIEVVIATGRSYHEAKYVLEDAGIECPIICANGAEVRSQTGEVIVQNSLDINIAKKVTKVFEAHDAYYELYTNNGTYSSDYDKALTVIMDIFMSDSLKHDYEKSLKAAKERFESGLIHLVDNFDLLYNDETISINKLITFSFDEKVLQQVKAELSEIGGIAVSASGKENIEVNSVTAQKGIALADFVSKRNISMEETMAIGDNYNDVSMLTRVGHSVAMGNAPEDIKQQCDKITDTNANNGVGKAIMEVLTR